MGYTGEQKREYQRKWMLARREKAIEYLGGCCVTCGNVEELEFDHVVRELKVHNISQIMSRKWELLQEELDKCQLLCVECHMEKTIREMNRSPHGTHNRYTCGCRCSDCRLAHNASTTAWKQQKKLAG